LHLDFDDEEVSFLEAREVVEIEAHSRHALRKPPKRPRLYESSQHPEGDPPPVFASGVDDSVIEPQLVDGDRETRPRMERTISVEHENQRPSFQREISPLTDPTYLPSPSPSNQQPTRKHVATKGWSVTNVPNKNQKVLPVYSPEPEQLSQSPSETFGYVTNTGNYRCALCFSQLTDQEALDRHEAMSKLHLRNLKNPTLVSKGRAKLAQVTALPYPRAPQLPSGSPAAFRPLKIGGFDPPEQPQADGTRKETPPREHMQRFPDHKSSGGLAGSFETIETTTSPSLIDLSADTSGTIAPPESSGQRKVDKGKGRASPYNRLPQVIDSEMTANPSVLQKQQSAPTDPARVAPDRMRQPINDTTTNTSVPVPVPVPAVTKSRRLRPLEVAEILRLTGIRLAEEYISSHPDLIEQTMGRVQREFTASTAASASVGPATMDAGRQEETTAEDRRQEVEGSRRNAHRDRDVVVLD
jgi:hypothetical protein